MTKYSAAIAGFLCFAVLPAFADCPNLTGNWECISSSGGEYKQTLKVEGNVMTTTDDEGTTTLILDGLDHTADDGVQYNGRCRGDSIVLRAWGEQPDVFGPGTTFSMSGVMSAAKDLESYNASLSLVVSDEQGNELFNANNDDDCRKVK